MNDSHHDASSIKKRITSLIDLEYLPEVLPLEVISLCNNRIVRCHAITGPILAVRDENDRCGLAPLNVGCRHRRLGSGCLADGASSAGHALVSRSEAHADKWYVFL